MSFPSLFSESRTAQAAAFLLHQAGGQLSVLKLMKLLYLAERNSFAEYGVPISGDALVSMPQGPVLSRTLELINGARRPAPGGWEDWVSDRADHMVALTAGRASLDVDEDLLDLSDSDIKILERVWLTYGGMDKWALVDYTHSSAVPEWEDPHGSMLPISYRSLFEALGYDKGQAEELMSRLRDQSDLLIRAG
jgi:uncharacterized phage-associated protein